MRSSFLLFSFLDQILESIFALEYAISSSNNIKDFNNYLLKSLRTTKYENFIKNRLEYYANTDDL